MLGWPNDLAGLVMVGEERRWLATWPVRLAKAKVAGSNPVFRSNLKGPDAEDLSSVPGPSILAPRAGWHILGTRRSPPRGGSAFSVSLWQQFERRAQVPARPVHGTAAGRSATLGECRKEASSWQNAAYRSYGRIRVAQVTAGSRCYTPAFSITEL